MKKPPKKRTMTSFQPDEDVAEMLELAKKVGGFDVKTFTNAALRKYGPEILKKMAEDQQRKLKQVVSQLEQKKQPSDRR